MTVALVNGSASRIHSNGHQEDILGVVRPFDPKRIKQDPENPREQFDDIPELAESISTIGQTTPGKVTLIKGDPNFDAMLVDGERRWRACLLAKKHFEAYVVKDLSPLDRLKQAVGANFNQQPHNCIETARAILNILKLSEQEGKPLTHKEVGKIFGGKSDCWVSQHLSLLDLNEKVQPLLIPKKEEAEVSQAEEIIQGQTAEDEGVKAREPRRKHIPFAIGLLLTRFDDSKQINLAEKILEENMSTVKARRFLFQQQDGLQRQHRQRHPGEASEAFGNKIMSMQDQFGIYVDMTFDDLQRMFSTCTPVEIEQYLKILEDIEGTITALKVSIKKIHQKRLSAALQAASGRKK